MHKRIAKEYEFITAKITSGEMSDIHVQPKDDKLTKWTGYIKGPTGTPYENGKFHFTLDISNNYPMNPPKLHFTTKIWHPNFDTDGEICLDILKHNWTPALSIEKVLISVISLLNDPNPHSPLNFEAGQEYIKNTKQYNEHVKEWVKQYALQ